MTTDIRAALERLVELNDIFGGLDWKPWPAAIAAARAALAAPPSLEDRIAAADAAIEAGMERVTAIASPARAALAAEPVPVSERLPGSKDCDEKGRVWAWHFSDLEDVDNNGNFGALIPLEWMNRSHWTHWLPATALAGLHAAALAGGR